MKKKDDAVSGNATASSFFRAVLLIQGMLLPVGGMG